MAMSLTQLQLFNGLLYWEAPRVVFLEVTNHCNLRCVMCAHAQDDLSMDKGHMQWAMFEDAFKQCSHLRSLCLFSAGEPLLAKNWDAILKHCTQHLPQDVDISFSTNGLLLTRQKILPLLGRNIAITISIDGATRTTYEYIRQGGSFDRLIENIRLLNSLKDQYKTDRPSIEIAFAASRDNVTELPLIAQLAVQLRATQLVVAQRIFFNEDDFKAKSLLFAREQFDENLQEAVALCHRDGISIIHGGTYSGEIPPPAGLINRFFDMRADGRFACRTAEQHVSIGFKGLIRACCFIDHLFMGNLNYNTLSEVWHGHHYRRLRLDIRNGRFGDGCKNCPFFQLLNRHEQACLRKLNTQSHIPASPQIRQPYDVFALNGEFQRHMDDWQHGCISAADTIKRLLTLYEQDACFFEVANNIGVLYATDNDITNARKWINTAYAINPLDAMMQQNYDSLSL
ncbi:radical SAM protein [Candidatus Magnetobacterium casense]|uniref:Radical SAM protein n=1 Tax=Candidatus Magnetobacterium casense TaxID=1455061 RepID=A0ABS6RWQ7_9BACT|nr:radical SAM protein [Candidatus Magnetobacterium casensis]MBV6341072.1 radical SAM protein [Candidatus Magnetobacterium casensis]